jgi:hypothetical protein
MGRRYRDRGALQLGRAVVAALIRQLVFFPWASVARIVLAT